MKDKFRCSCPITSALDILGDRWTLVIIRDMLFEGKRTFKEFLESDESIATNILSSRLKMLEEFKIISKGKILSNKKTNIYILTQKGISLVPVLIELTIWSDANIRDFNDEIITGNLIDSIKENKEKFIRNLQENYKETTGYNRVDG